MATTTEPQLTFESSAERLRAGMQESYRIDEDNQPKELTPEENQSVNDIVDRVVEEAVESFKPLYDHLMSQIAKQKAIIEQLQESLALGAQEQGQEQGHEENAPQGEDDDGEPAQPQVSRIPQTKAKARIAGQVVAPTITNGKVNPPSVEWVAQNRKSGKESSVTAYNIFTMAYGVAFKSGRPAKGVWAEYDQKPWKALAVDTTTGTQPGRSVRRQHPESLSLMVARVAN